MFHIPAHKSGTAGQVPGQPTAQTFAPGHERYRNDVGPDTFGGAPPTPYNERVCNAIGALDWRVRCPPVDLLESCTAYCLDAVVSWPAGYATSRYETEQGSWWSPVLRRPN